MIKAPSIKRFIWVFSLLVSVFVNFPIIFLQLPRLNLGGRPLHEHDSSHINHTNFFNLEGPALAITDIFIQILICLLFSISLIFFFRSPRKKSKIQKISYPILMFTTFVVVLSSLNMLLGIDEKMMVITVIIRGLLVLGFGYFFSKFINETEQKNAILLENEHLKTENLQIQLNSLKNQLNPHFLFNSLNTLSWLINDDKAKSQQYLQKLSQVLRYSLSMQEQSLVSLKEELMLLDSYIFLLQIRFGENLRITKELSEIEKYKIPPLSTQLLIENAIKHNIISTTKPMNLTIVVDSQNQTLSVSNSLNLKPNSEGTGIGLANLNERFRILANQEIEIQQNEEFKVILPLIV